MFPAQLPAGPPHSGLSLLLGIASVLLVVGWTLSRFHRDRLRFALMKAALEKGVTRFPGMPPYWLVSLRQGITLVALGVGLATVGAGAWWMVRNVPLPTPHAAAVDLPPLPEPQDRPDARPPRPDPEDSHPRQGPDRNGPRHEDANRDDPRRNGGPGGPQDRPEDFGPPETHGSNGRLAHVAGEHGQGHPGRPAPMPLDPALEHWHEAQAQQTVGLVSAGTGFILILLGIVRMAFAKIEQRYVNEVDSPADY